MSATTNFITIGSTTSDDGRMSRDSVLRPELHNPRRCLRQPVLLVSDHNPSPHFITVDNVSGEALCSTSHVDPLDPSWLENAPGIQHPMMLAKWDAVCRKWSTPPTSPTSVAISDLGAERFPTLLLNHKKLPDSMLDIDGDRIDATPQSSPSLAPTKAETLPAEVAEMASVVLPLPTSWVGRMLAGWC